MLLFPYAKSGKLNESGNKIADGSRQGREFSYHLFTFRAIPDAQRKNKAVLTKESRLSLCPFFPKQRLPAQASKQRSRKLHYRVGNK